MDEFHFYNRLVHPRRQHSEFSYRLKQALRWLSRVATRSATAIGRPRHCPFGAEWQKGWAWWSLPKEAVDHLRDHFAPLVERGRMRFTLCGDEHVPATILFYSRFRDRMEPFRRFLVWPEGSSPVTLTRDHLPAIRASGDLFGRKFERAVDPFFLEL
jgi:hypothetical protein